MIKYIVFDFDGTLADTFNTFKEIAETGKFGEVTDEDYKAFRDKGTREMIKEKNLSPWQVYRIIYGFTVELKKKKNLKLFPNIVDLINDLSENYKLGILSSNEDGNIIQTMKNYNILDKFDFIFPKSSIFGKHKSLKKMCKKYEINPAEVIYVGDEDRDIIAANKVNIRNIAVTWGFNSEKRLKEVNPNYVANYPKGIRQLAEEKFLN